MSNSYINVPDNKRIHDTATDVEIEDAKVFLDNKWPKEALDIIDNAGLEAEYRAKLGGVKDGRLDKIVADKKIKMSSGKMIKPEITAFSVNGRIIQDAKLSFAVENEKIVKVSKDGVFSALGSGRTTVTATAEYQNIIKQREIEVFVDDKLAEISLENVPKNLFEGNKFKLSATFATLFNDDSVANAKITYSTDNPKVATVDAEEFLIGISEGKTNLVVSVEADGEVFVQKFPITVHKSGSFRNMNYNLITADEMISNVSSWYTTGTNDESARMEKGSGTVKIRTPGSGINGYGVYTGKKYLNEVVNFDYKYNSISGYVMVALRVQGETEGPLSKTDGSGCYLVVVKPDSIELQRVINGTSHMLYGKLTTNSALGGERDNKLMPHSETLNLQFGAVNYGDSVVLSLVADGQTVFEWFDDSPDAIKNEGHFGVIVRAGSLDISKPTESQERMAKALSRADGKGYFSDTLTHWSINDVAFLAGKKIVNGYADGTFRPDAKITRAEMCQILKNYFAFETKDYAGELKDVAASDWYADAVSTVLGAQIVPTEMVVDGKFLPNKSISRQETAVLIFNGAKKYNKFIMKQGDLEGFGDSKNISDWARYAVGGMVGEGIIQGDNNAMLNPSESITRAEAVAMLKRLISK